MHKGSKDGENMKKISVLQMIGSLLVMLGCVMNAVEAFVELPLAFDISAFCLLVIGVILLIIVLAMQRKLKKK